MLSEQATWEDDDGQFWCELNKTTPITPSVLLPDCIFLSEAAEKHGGEFDGWACPVTT